MNREEEESVKVGDTIIITQDHSDPLDGGPLTKDKTYLVEGIGSDYFMVFFRNDEGVLTSTFRTCMELVKH